jgi:hypothetical protein
MQIITIVAVGMIGLLFAGLAFLVVDFAIKFNKPKPELIQEPDEVTLESIADPRD